MRHYLEKTILLPFILACLTVTAFGQSYSGGSGTSVDPYQVSTKADLKYLSENSGESSKHFIQTADITFTDDDFLSGGDFYNGGGGFIPIGTYYRTMFTGSYDGNGHKISNLLINPIRDNGAIYNNNAFFGFTGSASEIKNLRIENFSISGGRIIGGLVGRNYGTINNCYSTGSGAMGTDDVGGLVGYNSGTISNCGGTAVYVQGSIQDVGGLVGVNGGPIDSSFWNIDLAGTTGIGGGTITGGTGKITTEMKTKSTFTDAGWIQIYGI